MSKKISIVLLSVLISNFIYSQSNDIGSLLSQAKKHYSDRNSLGPNSSGAIKRSIDCLEKALAINPNHKEANELSKKINLEVALDNLETGKRKLYKYYDFTLRQDRYSDWFDGVYFYKALEHFANAYKSGLDSTLVNNYVREIDSIGKLVNENFFSFSNDNLYIMSTSFQFDNIQKIKSLKGEIKSIQDTADLQTLFDLYTQLVDLEKFNYEGGKFQGYDYNQARIERAKLAIKLGNIDDGCYELYTADYMNFRIYLPLCEEWNNKFSAQRQKKYIEEEKAKASQWYKDNPEKIKFLSLFGKSFETVEAYLGKPTLKQYKIDVGVGWKGKQFIGNKYQNKQGTYEVGFINGNVHFIKFTPSIYLSFSTTMMKYMGEESRFDFKSEIGGICGVEQNSGNIGNVVAYCRSCCFPILYQREQRPKKYTFFVNAR